MPHATCIVCGCAVPQSTRKPFKYCGKECRDAARRAKYATDEDYRQKRRASAAPSAARRIWQTRRTGTCLDCGGLSEPGKLCNPCTLKRARTIGAEKCKAEAERQRKLPVIPKVPKVRSHKQPKVRVKAPRLFVNGHCAECGQIFTWVRLGKTTPVKHCSKRCKINSKSKRQRENSGQFAISARKRASIYQRDNWTCQLCGDPIDRDAHYLDPMAPTLDHIEPQSLTLVPDHTEANLRTAHRVCNTARSNRVTASELQELRKRRKATANTV